MQRVIGPDLPVAGEVEAGEDAWHPIEGLAAGQLLGVVGPRREVEVAQVVGRVEAAGEERHCQQRHEDNAGQQRPGEQVAFAMRRDAGKELADAECHSVCRYCNWFCKDRSWLAVEMCVPGHSRSARSGRFC